LKSKRYVVDDDNRQESSPNEADDSKGANSQGMQIASIYFIKKLKRVFFILFLSTCILSFYLGGYFQSSNIFNSISVSFTLTSVVNT
jgi:hypothetical protein